MRKGILFVSLVSMAYLFLTVGFNFLPRSSRSELEKRDLMRFPSLTLDSLADGSFTAAVSSWYSDTEPYRDSLMYLSMQFRDLEGVRFGAEHIEFVSSDSGGAETTPEEAVPVEAADTVTAVQPYEYVEGGAEEVAKVASSGIILVGSGENVRALMGFFGTEKGGEKYAEVINQYGAAFGNSVKVWCMPIPTSTEFYCPAEAAKFTKR